VRVAGNVIEELSHYQSKTLDAILEVALDIRDLQAGMNKFLFQIAAGERERFP
jgi:hypothetical protein